MSTSTAAAELQDDRAAATTLVHAAPTADETGRELHRAVWMLAWPSVVTMLLQTFNSFLDRFFVGSLGPDALAAVGVGSQLMFLFFSVGMSISVGTTALVSRFTGAGQPEDARTTANQSFWISWLISIACLILVLPFRVRLVSAMGVDHHASELCVSYLTITMLGVPFLFLMIILSGLFRGMGDTVTPLLVMVFVNVVHLGGDYLLIFGRGGLPRLGVAGGALALCTSQVVGSILYLLFLQRSAVRGFLHRRPRLEIEWVRRIFRIGVPAGLQNVSRVLSQLLFTGILAHTPESTAAVAALTIGLTSESIAFMPGIGFSTAANTLTGQNLGAGRPERAERAAWSALMQGLGIMVVMAVVFYHWAPLFTGIFTHDAAVTRLSVAYLRTMAFSEPFLAFGMILSGALSGAGETKGPAWASFFCMWAVRLPLAYAATHLWGFGAVGAWWSMAISTTVLGLINLAQFKWGRWQHVTV